MPNIVKNLHKKEITVQNLNGHTSSKMHMTKRDIFLFLSYDILILVLATKFDNMQTREKDWLNSVK